MRGQRKSKKKKKGKRKSTVKGWNGNEGRNESEIIFDIAVRYITIIVISNR